MARPVKGISVIIFAAALSLSCSGLKDISLTSVDNIRIKSIEDNIVTFNADVGVSNPSAVGFRLKELEVDVTADGVYLGKLKNNDIVRIPAHSDSLYNIAFSLRLSNLLATAGTIISLSRKSEVNIDLKGYVRSTSGLVTRKTDITQTTVINLSETGFF